MALEKVKARRGKIPAKGFFLLDRTESGRLILPDGQEPKQLWLDGTGAK